MAIPNRAPCFLAFSLILNIFLSLPVLGQAIELTSPLESITVKEGDDYAKDQLNNPWDFNERRDFGWEQNYLGSSIKISNGKWVGRNKHPGAYVFPLFGGFKDTVYAEGLPGDKTLPRFGINHPINTSKYYVLSYRLHQTNPTSYCVYWNNDTTTSFWPDGKNVAASYDGFANNNKLYRYPSWYIYSHNLKNLSSFNQYKGSWSKKVYALRLDPSFNAPAGSTTEYDWIRLVDPNSAPTLTIAWNATNIPKKSLIYVYLDNNNRDYNGTPFAILPATEGTGLHSFSTAILPPGNYYFYVSLRQDGTLNELARTAYSAKLGINSKPTAYFTAPTPVSGEDYATSVVGDPWDMSGPEDLASLALSYPYAMRQFYGEQFNNGKFEAVADPSFNGSGMTDAQLHMRMSSTPIDTRKFRYITYRMKIDNSQFADLSDMVEFGFVTRVAMWNQGIVADGVTPPPHITYEGWHTYTYDMRGSNAGTGYLTEGGYSYKDFNSIANFRVDPMETLIPTAFSFDWIKFSAQNETSANRYVISWIIEDTDNSRFTVKIYRDKTSSGYDGSLIAQLTDIPSGNYSYSWNTTGLSNGNYYVYFKVSDGINTFQSYAPVHIAVGNNTSISESRTKYDYDGDGKSDRVLFRPGSPAKFLVKSSLKGNTTSSDFGKRGDKPYEGDFDGDKKSDLAFIRYDSSGNIRWYVKRSTDRSLIYKIWGKRGDLIAIGDYDGDGKDDLGVFRSGQWLISYADGRIGSFTFGASGDKPVPADYDGDGATDLAVWRPKNATWYIKNSGYSSGYAATSTTTRTWGSSSHSPIPADYTGDGLADLAVYDANSSTWYVRDILNKNSFFSVIWGSSGDEARAGDYNGDRIADLTTISPSERLWSHNYRNGQQLTQQWGLASDLIPQ